MFFDDRLLEEVDKIPQRIIRKDDSDPFRCCIYKDREIVKQRCITALGFGLENEDEIDGRLLSDYAKEALLRKKHGEPILTFINEACKACVKGNYIVTNICKNCVAKNCMINCPKKAIELRSERAFIDPEKCANCGICMKLCPYHAIVYVPVPCEESRPTGAIGKNKFGKEEIDYDKCIFCGKCLKSCPFGAIAEKSQIVDVIKHIRSGKKVAALIAPSAIGQFEGGLYKIVSSLRKLGFSLIAEVALGADMTSRAESEELSERLEKGDKLMGTSCCPSYIEAVKKHNADFMRFVSSAKTPMVYTAEFVKKKAPECITVFIGPCIGKKHEGIMNEFIDFVLTYEELSSLFSAKNVDIKNLPEEKPDFDIATDTGRYFALSGKVADAIKSCVSSDTEVNAVLINGFTRQNIKILTSYANGGCPGNLVEVMSCEGGCIAGSGTVSKPQKTAGEIVEFINKRKIMI